MRPPLATSALLILRSIALFLLIHAPAFAITPSSAAHHTSQQTIDVSNLSEITDEQPLSTIVVTASRTPQRTSHALAQSTSFDAQAIAASSATDLPGLLPF